MSTVIDTITRIVKRIQGIFWLMKSITIMKPELPNGKKHGVSYGLSLTINGTTINFNPDQLEIITPVLVATDYKLGMFGPPETKSQRDSILESFYSGQLQTKAIEADLLQPEDEEIELCELT